MSSIALFPCVSTVDSGIIGELLSISTLKVYTDDNLFKDTAAQYHCNTPRLRKMMYGRTSLFNPFTLEKEKVINMFHSILSDKLCGPQQHLFYGFLTSLIPPGQKEILTVLAVDTKGNRIDRCMYNGLSKNEAKKHIHNHDLSASCWTDFLFKKDAYDSSLYDLVLPIENRDHRQVTKEILSCFH